MDGEVRLHRLRAGLTHDDDPHVIVTGPAEDVKLAVIRQAPTMRVEQRFLLELAAWILQFDGDVRVADALVRLRIIEGDQQMLRSGGWMRRVRFGVSFGMHGD